MKVRAADCGCMGYMDSKGVIHLRACNDEHADMLNRLIDDAFAETSTRVVVIER